MSTKIDWCDEVWNPTTGCTKGCSYCYAKSFAERMKCNPIAKIAHKYRNGFIPTVHPEHLKIPLTWHKSRRVFVDSMGDLFDPEVPFDFIDQVMAVIAMSGKHTFLVLTKQPERMREYFSQKIDWREHLAMVGSKNFGYNAECMVAHSLANHENTLCRPVGWPMLNLWLGVSVTNQDEVNGYIPLLFKAPAAKRFVSIEPMLGPVDLMNLKGPGNCFYQCLVPITGCEDANRPALDWVICGGQTGKKAAKLEGNWVARLRNQCKHVGVPFFFKGWGETDKSLRNHPQRHQLNGKIIREFPV